VEFNIGVSVHGILHDYLGKSGSNAGEGT